MKKNYLSIVLVILLGWPGWAATYTVTKTADDGTNDTLRWAINQLNDGDAIAFNIPNTDGGYVTESWGGIGKSNQRQD
jgi:hypothetical protein